MLQMEVPSQREATTRGVEQTPDVKSVVDLVLYAMFVQTVKEDVDLILIKLLPLIGAV